ncbi:MAG: PIN domain-containing protein [Candidatus Bathyarchaeota archaeon]|nr:PIN domain-containing protein [Candidatus Bathyarchaeota archaeon]
MPSKAVYDTRFFVEYFYSSNSNTLRKLSDNLVQTKNRIVSTVTVYEIYKTVLSREGREVAKLRTEVLTRDFQVKEMTEELAIMAAEISHITNNPMADCVIAATAQKEKTLVITDDPHFNKIKGIRVQWPIK